MTLNVERLIRIRDLILAKPEQFNISVWIRDSTDTYNLKADPHDCGTVACIGGWAELLYRGEDASRALGLPESSNLFTPTYYDRPSYARDFYNAKVAASVIDKLIATGKVEWPALPPLQDNNYHGHTLEEAQARQAYDIERYKEEND